jgi:hypothetical protein
MRALVFATTLVAVPLGVFAQHNTGLEASFFAGKILKHTPKFRPPIPDLSTGISISYLKQTTGKRDWEQRRHYPIWGIAATYTNYGIDSIYGTTIGLYPFLQAYIVRGKRLEWTLRGGMGLGYTTGYYKRSPEWDTINNAIGSSINNYTTVSTDLRYSINKHWSIQAGLNFAHLSNGVIKKPNLGINMWAAQIGIRYWLSDAPPTRIERKRPKLPNRILAQARLGIAFNESGNADGPIYPTYIASAWASRRYKSRNKVLLGLDYSYHTGIYAFLRNNEINVGSERANSWKCAVFLGHEWMFGRLAVIAQLGYYLKDAAIHADTYYQKLGYNYYLLRSEQGVLKELCLNGMLKAHKADAELVEFGIGFGF